MSSTTISPPNRPLPTVRTPMEPPREGLSSRTSSEPRSGWPAPWRSRTTSARRFEHKYQLTLSTYYRVRAALRPFVRHCWFSESAPDHRYFIRSLYFDTYDYLAYFEKVTGQPNRIKLRLRSYAPRRDAVDFVSVELKTRSGSLVEKFATRVAPEECDHFLRHRTWIDQADPVLSEFRRLALLRDQRPKLLVDYRREAFLPKDHTRARITFDQAMAYAQADRLFPQTAFFRPPARRWVILEVKIAEALPDWLQGIVRTFGLKAVPNSKYAHGIEQTQHAIFR